MNYCMDSSVILLRDTAAGNCYSQITAAPNCQASMAPHTLCAPPNLPCTSLLHLRGVTVQLTPRPGVYDWIVTRHANEHTAHACIQPPGTIQPTWHLWQWSVRAETVGELVAMMVGMVWVSWQKMKVNSIVEAEESVYITLQSLQGQLISVGLQLWHASPIFPKRSWSSTMQNGSWLCWKLLTCEG